MLAEILGGGGGWVVLPLISVLSLSCSGAYAISQWARTLVTETRTEWNRARGYRLLRKE